MWNKDREGIIDEKFLRNYKIVSSLLSDLQESVDSLFIY